MGIPFIKDSNGTISAFVKGSSVIVNKSHHFYNECLEALKNANAEDFLKFASLKQTIESITSKSSMNPEDHVITVKDDVVYYNGNEMHHVVADKILDFISENLNPDPLIRFLSKLMQNPSSRSVNELYNFLEHGFLPIHEDGDFLAYKRVNNDWKDYHTNSIPNNIGTEVFKLRNEVDDDSTVECSNGLHVGTKDYVKNFHSGDGHVILVKVNPKDVVSVPKYDSTKMRVCRYFILEELHQSDFGINATVYTPASTPIPASITVNDFSESLDEDEDWDELDDSEEFEVAEPKKSLYDEWIAEVCQGSLKDELLALSVRPEVADAATDSDSFKIMQNLATGSLKNLLQRTDVIDSFYDFYC